MFSKEEKKTLSQKFWSQFDDFCDSITDLAWRKKKWILHDTKISHIALKFDIGSDRVMVVLEINHGSENRRFLVYELVERYRLILQENFAEELTWDLCYVNSNNQQVSRIYIEKKGVNYQNISDWPMIYDFMAKNMLQLQDNFIEIQEALKEEVNILYRDEAWG